MENENSRPSSYYENSDSKYDHKSSNNNVNKECKFEESPTLTHSLNTTVPLNVARQDIGGKHAPTRNSLRHSRMIVLNKSGQVTCTDLPLFLKHYKLLKFNRMLVIGFGVCLTVLSVWLIMWSPNIRSRDNPYWNAGPAIISGISGLFFIKKCPKLYTNRNITYWIKSLKSISIAFSFLTLAASLAVCILSVIHLISLHHLNCAAPDQYDITCICRNNSTESALFSDYHYVDLNCFEVNNILAAFASFICAVSALIVLLEFVYLYIHWASRKVYLYTRVPLNGNANR